MRIAFTGAQSTGKTTLLEALKGNETFRYSYEFVDEITRRMVKKGLEINETGSDTTQLLILNEHIKNQLYRNVVMDRCLLDGVVYTNWLHNNGSVSKWVYDYAYNLFEHYKDNYDFIFYLKPEFAIVDDGVRSTDIKFRDEINELFESHISQIKAPVVTLTGSVKERLEKLNNTLETYGK